jgi:hypothetical protein
MFAALCCIVPQIATRVFVCGVGWGGVVECTVEPFVYIIHVGIPWKMLP